jgi:hopene-associated glycosyltransferase HpnB
MLLAASIVTCLIWIYLTTAHGRFWRVAKFSLPASGAGETATRVVAVVPARNEADVIAPSILSLLQQHGIPLHVVLVDDSSTDGTASIARQAAEASNCAERLTVISGLPLPSGWSGKLWAVHQGVQSAARLNPDFILLTDADVVHAPDDLQHLLAHAETGNYDLVSLMVRLHCKAFAERALIPAFVFFFLMLYPPSWITNPRRKIAGAAGGCILIRPNALLKAGGIEAIRNEIIDDCALAARVKQSGGRVWLGLTPDTRSVRPYNSFSAIGHMISRAAFNQLRHSTLLLLATLLGLAITYLAPPALLLSGHLVPTLLGTTAWLLMSICFWPTIRLYRLNPLWTLLLPAIALFYMGATLHSAFKFWTGKGGEWKGRVQDPVQS